MQLNQVPAVVMLLVISGILLGAGSLALGKFKDTVTGVTNMDNITKTAIGNSTLGLNNLAEQIPTVGTIIGVAIIIAEVT